MGAILKRVRIVKDKHTTTRVMLFGLTVYETESINQTSDNTPRPVGFIQYPIEAPTEVEDDEYFPEEF